MKRFSFLLGSVVVSGLLFAGCTVTTSDTAPTQNTGDTSMNDNTQPEVKELITEDITVGEGQTAEAGDMVTVHYTGTLMDGTVFDSSHNRNTPFTFELGGGQVIQGWDEGVAGMQEGGTRKLTIPSDMAYGERGVPGAIPPSAPLVFEVELLEVSKAE